MRPVGEIRLDWLGKNLRTVKAHVPEHTEIIAVVKANAYGHGMNALAPKLEKDVALFAVATWEEALQLRKVTPKKILVLGQIPAEMTTLVYNLGIIPGIFAEEYGKRLLFRWKEGKKCGEVSPASRLPVHLAFDTGMHRVGLPPEKSLLSSLLGEKEFQVEGVYSHLADGNSSTALQQGQVFSSLIQDLPPHILTHISATDGIFHFGTLGGNTVRPGLALYGYGHPSLRPLLSLYAYPMAVYFRKKGEKLGYGLAYTLTEDRYCCVLPLGYGDGLPRWGAPYPVTFWDRNRPHPGTTVGRISMDSCTAVPLDGFVPTEQTRVVFLPSLQVVAEKAHTVPYEILSRLGDRIHREYR